MLNKSNVAEPDLPINLYFRKAKVHPTEKHWSRITISDCWSWNRGESLGFGVKLSLLCKKIHRFTTSIHAPMTRGAREVSKSRDRYIRVSSSRQTYHKALWEGGFADRCCCPVHSCCMRRHHHQPIRRQSNTLMRAVHGGPEKVKSVFRGKGKKHIGLPRERNALTALQLAVGIGTHWNWKGSVWFLLFAIFQIQPSLIAFCEIQTFRSLNFPHGSS